MNKEDLAAKADWEGGLPEAIFSYGLKAEDLPDDAPSRVKLAWKRLDEAVPELEIVSDWLFREG